MGRNPQEMREFLVKACLGRYWAVQGDDGLISYQSISRDENFIVKPPLRVLLPV